MSTRSTTHLKDSLADKPTAIIYRHSDGYPSGHGADLLTFFADVKAQTQDTRFSDPSYLAAKLVVWLARQFASSYDFVERDGKRTYDAVSHADTRPLDFISVGVVSEDPGDIEYRYIIDCGVRDGEGFPLVAVEEAGGTALGELRDVLRAEGAVPA